MGGKTQMVGMIAGLTMLLVLFFGTAPLAEVPSTALAAVIMVSAVGLLDTSSLRDLFQTSRREFFLSVITTLGVLVLGALPGVILSVTLSLLWLLTVAARPYSAILGRAPGVKGFHDILDYPNARTIDGLLLYRFQGNLVFFNVDYFRECLLEAIASSKTPIEWVVLDASPINILDATAVQKLDEIRNELASRGIVLVTAEARKHLERFFEPEWVRKHSKLYDWFHYPTIKSAIHAFNQRKDAKAGSPPTG
jgi:MFS superfamily sulfate permease-like transporter